MTLIDENGAPSQPGSRQSALIGLQVFLVSVALIVYTLRVYTRAFILRSLAKDDYIMGLAMVSYYLQSRPEISELNCRRR